MPSRPARRPLQPTVRRAQRHELAAALVRHAVNDAVGKHRRRRIHRHLGVPPDCLVCHLPSALRDGVRVRALPRSGHDQRAARPQRRDDVLVPVILERDRPQRAAGGGIDADDRAVGERDDLADAVDRRPQAATHIRAPDPSRPIAPCRSPDRARGPGRRARRCRPARSATRLRASATWRCRKTVSRCRLTRNSPAARAIVPSATFHAVRMPVTPSVNRRLPSTSGVEFGPFAIAVAY